MSNTAHTTVSPATISAVGEVLATATDGMTARKIANTSGLTLAEAANALKVMAEDGTATVTPDSDNPTRRTADRWSLTPADATTPEADPTDTDTGTTDTGTTDTTDTGTTDPATADGDPAPATADGTEAPTDDTTEPPTPDTETTDGTATPDDGDAPAPPVVFPEPGNKDHMKIIMVAGMLGTDGVTAAHIAAETGLRTVVVGKVLTAMELAGAAVLTPAADHTQSHTWTRGDGELSAVSLVNTPTNLIECPECHHRFSPARTAAARRIGTAPGVNSDGGRVLGKNELRDMVAAFLTEHPGHEFSPTDISKVIGRSSGAISNALAKLVVTSVATITNEAPMRYALVADTADEPAAEAA
jgi:hypothetical protein